MKTILNKKSHALILAHLSDYYIGIAIILMIISSGCNRLFDEFHNQPQPNLTYYKQTNLVSDTAAFNASLHDSTLINAWGIAINPSGIFWISANNKGVSEIYDMNGTPKRKPVVLPTGGKPTGQVYNGTTDFMITAANQVAKFIFASEDGKIYAWSSGDTAKTVSDQSSTDAVFKGIELAKDGADNFLYATDFHNGKIVVFDKTFTVVTTKPFSDPSIPAGFAPFNIRLIDSLLYVTYAKQLGPNNEDDQKGVGNGYVDIFKTNGTFVKRFASAGQLNSPWGIEKAPEGFGLGKYALLVGNFGNGYINVFDKTTGVYTGQLKDYGTPIVINGLWAITFPDGNVPGDDPNKLYFTAGPFDEGHGLFGYLTKR